MLSGSRECCENTITNFGSEMRRRSVQPWCGSRKLTRAMPYIFLTCSSRTVFHGSGYRHRRSGTSGKCCGIGTSFLCHRIHELSLFFLDFSPFPTDSGDVGKCAQPEKWVIFIPQILQKSSAVGRGFPICEPTPLATDNVHQGISHRNKAATQVACELLRTERRSCLQNPAVGPPIVFVQ